jgi:hypothetical protein
MRYIILACAVCLAITTGAPAQRPQVAVPIFEAGINHFPDDETIPQAALVELYKTELGKAYDPKLAPKLDAAHGLLERYFQMRTASGRKATVAALEATNLDPNILGRLCRIRSNWPALLNGGVFYVNQKVGAYGIQYFLGVPKAYDRTRSWPLAIKLPAATPFLTQPSPDAQHVVQLYTTWIQDDLAKHPDALVLMPLLDLNEMWGPSYTGINRVLQPMLDAANHVNVDPARIYMAGHSTGALGVWNLALRCPTYFAAINPLAGAANEDWEKLRLMNLHNTLPVIWHDDTDKVIKINFATQLVDELKRQKIEVVFDQTKDAGHVPSDPIVDRDYSKMRTKIRDLYPPEVWLQTSLADVMFNRVDWVQIYQQLDTGKELQMFFPRSSGHMTVYEKSCSVKVSIRDNQIDAAVDNVDSLRFYVNDQMIDFSKPVTVLINKRQRFKGLLKPSVDQMLRDQLFLKRGWRYFTSGVDIEMVDHGPSTRPAAQPTTAPLHKGRIVVGPQ